MAGKIAGIDWASETHALCVGRGGRDARARAARRPRRGGDRRSLPRAGAGLAVERVAIERPDGILVDRLLDDRHRGDRRCTPTRSRPPGARFAVARGKSDALRRLRPGRAGAHRRPPASGRSRPDGDETKALRALTRAREDLVAAQGAAGQPAARPARGLLARRALIFADVDSPIALAFCERYPSPADARGLGAQAAGRLPGAPRLLRPPQLRASCSERMRSAPAGRSGGPRPRRRSGRGARPGRRAQADRRRDRRAHLPDPRRPRAPIPTRRSSGRSSATPRRRSARRR